MKTKEQKLHTKLKIFFWANLLLFVALLLVLLYLKGPHWANNSTPNLTLERCAIMLALLGIPLSLKLFHTQVKKAEKGAADAFLYKYKQMYIFRMLALDIVIGINMLGFQLYTGENFILMAIITIFALLFCYPSKESLLPDIVAKEISE